MTNLKISACAALTASLLLAGIAHAATPLTLGVGAGVVQSPYKSYDRDIYPVPVVTYDNDNFWIRGVGAGYYLWNDGEDKLSVMGYWDPTYFKPGDSDNKQLKRLDKRHSSMMAGLSYIHNTQYGFLQTSLAGDVLDNSNGIIWDLGWLYRWNLDRLTVTPGIGVTWQSENYNDYYYGVSRDESRRSGLKQYDADDNWNPWLALTANFKLTDNFSVYGTARYTRLTSEIKDSPMVDKSWTGLLSTGVTYSF